MLYYFLEFRKLWLGQVHFNLKKVLKLKFKIKLVYRNELKHKSIQKIVEYLNAYTRLKETSQLLTSPVVKHVFVGFILVKTPSNIDCNRQPWATMTISMSFVS